MGKKNSHKKNGASAGAKAKAASAPESPPDGQADEQDGAADRAADGAPAPGKMRTKEYEQQMRLLHAELVALQEWVKASGAKICIVFEGA